MHERNKTVAHRAALLCMQDRETARRFLSKFDPVQSLPDYIQQSVVRKKQTKSYSLFKAICKRTQRVS